MEKDHPFAFAGLWGSWKREDAEPIESCTIITTDANKLMASIHDRMPVILPDEVYDQWLDPKLEDAKQLESLLVPYAGKDLVADPISTLVNSPRNDSPAVLEPQG